MFDYVEADEVLRCAMAFGDPRRYAAAFAAAAAREALVVCGEPLLRAAVDAVDAWVSGAQPEQRACLEAYKALAPLVDGAAQWEEPRGRAVVNPPLAAIKAARYALLAVYGQQPPALMASLASREAATALAESRRQYVHIVLSRHRRWLTPELPNTSSGSTNPLHQPSGT